MPAILLTGGTGQVGGAILRLARPSLTVIAPARVELDLADPAALAAMMASRRWDAIVNCAAYTAVDRAEGEVVAAWTANALAPAALAAAARAAGIPIVQVSTDYVFDGSKPAPYVEDDPVAPLGVYGASKEAGEQAVRTANPAHVILRTAWVVSAHGGNFVKTMLRLAAERDTLRVVEDQRGSPTSAADLAAALMTVAVRLADDPEARTGVFHFSNAGPVSWADFAREIFAQSAAQGGPSARVEGIPTADYPTPARRPANSLLSHEAIRAAYGVEPRPWQAALSDILDELIGPMT